jgi:hypothetical protein
MLLLVTSTARISSVCSSIPLSANVPFACRAMDVDLAPQAAFGTAMLARVPFTFALSLDPSAIHKKMQRPR